MPPVLYFFAKISLKWINKPNTSTWSNADDATLSAITIELYTTIQSAVKSQNGGLHCHWALFRLDRRIRRIQVRWPSRNRPNRTLSTWHRIGWRHACTPDCLDNVRSWNIRCHRNPTSRLCKYWNSQLTSPYTCALLVYYTVMRSVK